MSLLDALARRTQAVAAPRAQAYADANRLHQVLIVRPAVEPQFNRIDGQFVPEAQPQVYAGAARIRPVSPSAQIELGDAPEYWEDVTISIGLQATLEPRVDDLATITAAPPPNGSGVLGKVFRVVGVTSGGHLATGFTLACSAVAPSRWTSPPS